MFQLQDHTPNSTTRGDLVVKINTPGRHTVLQEETLVNTTPGADTAAEQVLVDTFQTSVATTYYLANPWTSPIVVSAGMVPSITTSTFPDGLYRLQVDFNISSTAYTFDEHFLYLASIDECISKKLDTYLASVCDKCKETKQLQTLQELVSLRTGAQLDVNAGRYTAAERKVTLMSNICTGSSCTCICGCS